VVAADIVDLDRDDPLPLSLEERTRRLETLSR
jgi:hypothetical protein